MVIFFLKKEVFMKKITTMILMGVFCLALFIPAGCEYYKGELVSLQEAYENNWITTEHLEQIAYYNNNNLNYPEELNKSIEKKIKAVYVYNYNKVNKEVITTKEVCIAKYFGFSTDCYFVVLNCSKVVGLTIEEVKEIGGVTFYFPQKYTILIYKIS